MVLVIENIKYNNNKYNEYFEEFPYPLSDFQKYAIQNIVDGNNVFCNVPTGSGKTLPALFAISHFVLKQKRKVIYCSPIKSLSNQKYYEFKLKFPESSIGLITGDIKINQNADIIICTTEILMNFLMKPENNNYLLDLSINDIAMVILDECHYVFDIERGYVWETVIIKLPTNIQLLLLSGSFKEPIKFCEWIEERKINNELLIIESIDDNNSSLISHKDICACIIDKKRIVPLIHYSYITVNEGFFKKIKDKKLSAELRNTTNNLTLLQNDKGVFNDLTYHKIQNTLKEFKIRNQYTNHKFILNNVVEFIKNNEMLPAICFVFSRKLCERFAKDITVNVLEDDSKIPYTISNELEQFIRKKIPNYIEYLQLPEYIELIKLLEKGIAYHHSGMLPILRELVEFAINENKVKLLFATESFGIGLNCAIKTTIFTQLKKHDGLNERFLYSHEYLQMSGRAGRRGIDTIGYVIHLNNIFSEQPSLLEYKTILKCQAPKMKSQYYISYNTILGFNDKNIETKSILEYEINKQIEDQQKIIIELQIQLVNKDKMIMMCKTPQDIIYQYIELINLKNTNLNSKKQKNNDRQIQLLQDLHYNIINDTIIINSFKELKEQYKNEDYFLLYLKNYIQNQINGIYNILKTQDYFIKSSNNKWLIASNIHEIHPLVITDYIITQCNNTLNDDNLSIENIIELLSLWSDIKIKNDLLTMDDTIILPSFVKEIRDIYNKYYELENENNISYKTNIETSITSVYLGNIFKMWAIECNNIEECKFFIQEQLNNRGISLGDFTKGCLKIVAISKELEKVLSTINNYLILSQKFGQIERLLCKFIVTSQSLYI